MEVREYYDAIGGNYEDVKSRLMKDDLILRFVIKFKSDESYQNLAVALEKKDFGEAFRAAHTLKGVSRNLSFDRLGSSAASLTEILRKWETEAIDETACERVWEQVTRDYRELIDMISKL